MEKSNRIRKHSFSMRVDNQLYLMLDAKKEKAGMKKSDYIRNIILFATTEERTRYSSSLAEEMSQELNLIGNAVNETAHAVNSRGNVLPIDLENLMENWSELIEVYVKYVL